MGGARHSCRCYRRGLTLYTLARRCWPERITPLLNFQFHHSTLLDTRGLKTPRHFPSLPGTAAPCPSSRSLALLQALCLPGSPECPAPRDASLYTPATAHWLLVSSTSPHRSPPLPASLALRIQRLDI
ncbi:hypothetical protein E2C01_030116 [Portunus trituberculatus]|uniref:Uncharacterized protein n=1 Tax=Portunus trituberculatus TaxID=210409 RepID=A0A5B7EPM7_PORTR|nr:hypothetical protein [Portunus trituberculatus]